MSIIVPRKVLGDARIKLRDEPERSVHCCVTSPPYLGLRSYLRAEDPSKGFEIGQERTVEEHISNLLEVFREVRRVLRDDGILWVNYGDRYTSGGRRTYDRSLVSTSGFTNRSASVMRPVDPPKSKKKELCMLPSRLAIAMSEDGWYLRAALPWLKRNSAPESAEDRPGSAIEWVFMFTKCADYFYDRFAVMQPSSDNTHPRGRISSTYSTGSLRAGLAPMPNPKAQKSAIGSKQNAQWNDSHSGMVSERNFRNTDLFMKSWQGLLLDDEGDPMALVVNPKGVRLDHYATFPPKLVEPLIQCSTSDGGCCKTCGENLERVIEASPDLDHQCACGGDQRGEYHGNSTKDYATAGAQDASETKKRILAGMKKRRTIGWKLSCKCQGDGFSSVTPDRVAEISKPCVVLDPFGGVGTVSMVATALGRESISIELNPESVKQSDSRDGQTGMHLV